MAHGANSFMEKFKKYSSKIRICAGIEHGGNSNKKYGIYYQIITIFFKRFIYLIILNKINKYCIYIYIFLFSKKNIIYNNRK